MLGAASRCSQKVIKPLHVSGFFYALSRVSGMSGAVGGFVAYARQYSMSY
jgi:hypothetical protein